MLCHAPGINPGSDFFFPTFSERERELFYYIVICGSFSCNTQYRVDREDFASYLLFYVKKGQLSITTRGKTYVASAHQVALLNCCEPHKYSALTDTEFDFIHFNGGQSAQYYEEFYNTVGVVIPAPSDHVIEKNMQTCLSACRTEQQIKAVTASRLLYDCLCSLLENSQDMIAERVHNPQIIDAMQYIRRHYAEDISLKQIADSVNLSPYYFARQFKQQSGYSPYEFTIICRINAAKHLLKTTDKTIKDIAYTIGYNSEKAFANSFTQKVGISPMKFRKF